LLYRTPESFCIVIPHRLFNEFHYSGREVVEAFPHPFIA